MGILQILMLLFTLFAWSRAVLRLKNKDISLGEFLFWSCIWLGAAVLLVFPIILDTVSELIGASYLNIVLYSSIIFLFYMIFRVYVKIENQGKEITKLVRELSIKNAKKKK